MAQGATFKSLDVAAFYLIDNYKVHDVMPILSVPQLTVFICIGQSPDTRAGNTGGLVY
jgi:hypothetical protein